MAIAKTFADKFNTVAPTIPCGEIIYFFNALLVELKGGQIIGSPEGAAEFLFPDGSIIVWRSAA